MVTIGNDWDALLGDEFKKEYYLKIRSFLKEEYKTKTVYPDMYDIFNALKYTSYANTKVLLLGQDPYHGPGQAHGLAFSVKRDIPIPPSLKNMYAELKTDIPGFEIPTHGYLKKWADEGVMLLNTSLTVVGGMANSHSSIGWEILTDRIIQVLNEREDPVVFLLWGNNAKKKEKYITNPRHLVLKAAHPSPLSAYNGFFGCKHFSKTNEFLVSNGKKPIDWQIN
ncbi:MAG: uracil-DNA glycosylase [Clostridia bacterium]|nr:uracil-DNA glycosylase [Clostridia bacterium]